MAVYKTDANKQLVKTAGNAISAKHKYIVCTLSSAIYKNYNTLAPVVFNTNNNQSEGYLTYNGNGTIIVLKNCKIKVSGCVNHSGYVGSTRRFGIYQGDKLICMQQNIGSVSGSGHYECLNAVSPIVSATSGDILKFQFQNNYNGNSEIREIATYFMVEVID